MTSAVVDGAGSVSLAEGASGPNEPRQSLAGTSQLLRFVLRRDRRRLPLWVLGIIVLTVVGARAIWNLYETPADIAQYVASVQGNPAVVMFAGPGYGFDDPNIGTILVNEMSIWMSVVCALMSIFLVVRHTRAEEDAGTADIVRAQPVGRYASITSAMTVAIVANLLIGIVSIVALIAVGYETAGSIALSGSYSLIGVLFAGIAAVAAQVGANSRSSLGIASGVLGASFVIRGVGDINENWLSWLSPLGWSIGVRAFADERWWALGLVAAAAVASVVAAYALVERRDLGSGLLREKPGSSHAPGWLSNPMAMAWRMQRLSIGAWAVGLFVMGMLFGSVSDAIEDMVSTNPELAEMMTQVSGATITDGFMASTLSILALLASGFALSSILRTRSNEASGYTEFVLTSPTSRSTLAVGALVVTVVGSVVVMVAGGAGLALGNLLVVGNEDEVLTLVGSSLTLLPAILVFVGLGLAVFGWLPRQAPFAWLAFAAVAAIGIFGDLLDLPDWATDWSPFAILPLVPAEDVEWGPMIGLVAVAAVLSIAGVVGFMRRDLEP